ncbi:MAG TPA: 23S rRNA (adenine(2503)-C(2))-methyltransferase RlmN [Acidobacteriaceae bacterium]|nr:23S rRNA (adenine(2503)-C(2))-methyltransferase RlmN [Acidobacteriaceae bacterium]
MLESESGVAMTTGRKPATNILDAPEAPNDLSLFGLKNEQLASLLQGFLAPPYRSRQLSEALYHQWAENLDEVTTFPKDLRQRMAEAGYVVGLPQITKTFTSVDGTERYLISTADGQTVETVWMPEGDAGELGDGSEASDYRDATICVSSQIGCAVNCQFCLTAKLGIIRNLTAGEIAGQVVAVLKRHNAQIGRDRINLVFMGMGEPFLNYDAFMDAVRLLVSEVGIAESRMTVSTSGIVPGIERFSIEPVRPKLAISLNAPNDKVREQVMPINRKWSIDRVIQAVRQVPLRAKEKVTFEYVLLGGVNDQLRQADEIGATLRKVNRPLKMNLIVWNPGPGISYEMPQPQQVVAFQERLKMNGIPAYIRRPRGRDIYAACGQLKQTVQIQTEPQK